MISFTCSSAGSNCPSSAVYGVANTTTHDVEFVSGAPTSVTYYNAWGQKIAEDLYAFGDVTYRRTFEYDNNTRQLKRESLPYKSNHSPSQWTTYFYDGLNRLEKITYANGGQLEQTYETNTLASWGTVNKVTTDITVIKKNPSTGATTSDVQTKIEYHNGLGDIVRVEDNNGVPIDYAYDGHGNLTSTTVNNNTATQVSMAYNNLGQKISISDPSAGVIAYQYTGFGELKTQHWQPNTANEKSMAFSYDQLGRIKARDDTDQNNATSSHTWQYDNQLKGALDKVLTGNTSGNIAHRLDYTYDNFGRATEVYDNGNTFVRSYDFYGREKTLLYPDGYKIERKYHQSGFNMATFNHDTPSEQIWQRGFATQNSANQRVNQLKYGNNLINTQVFNSNNTLAQIKVGNLTTTSNNYWHSGSERSNLTVDFDTLGNLTKQHKRKISRGRQISRGRLT